MYKKIALLDLDAFYASCEILKNPALNDIPFAVGGKEKRSVVTTCNYLARPFGVRSALSMHKALQLCPHLTVVPVDMVFYKQMSKQVHKILQNYSDIIEPASIDEFYIDLTDNKEFGGSASLTMQQIRKDIESLGITGSAGISSQKMVAKIASDENKPNGQFVVLPDAIKDYIANLPLKRIPGIGPVTQKKLQRHNLVTGGDIQKADFGLLAHLLGHNFAQSLYQRCHGVDNREVRSHYKHKSVSVEYTLTQDINTAKEGLQFFEDKLWAVFVKRFQHIDPQMRLNHQTVKLKMNDFSITTMTKKTHLLSADIFRTLIIDIWSRTNGRSVRLIGIGADLPDDQEKRQLELDLF